MWQLISAMELEQYLEEGMPMFLVDLRNREAYARGHIQGAVNIPCDELMERLGELPRGQQLVLYCHRGPNSMIAARQLSRMGYQVMDVYGGILAYRGKYIVQSR
ncbi:MAG: rhodanese-like domain-containing protein [Lachnospiraceae bacterium]|nr:rhodanese-like domain-containing protein [Lachnospiraceae bacterium]